ETSWKISGTLNVGQPARGQLTVTNTGESSAHRVSLEVRVPSTVRVLAADPEPVERSAFLGWKLVELKGGESVTIAVQFQCQQPGPLQFATLVRHTTAHQESFTVVEPKLELAVSGPQKVHVGEPASQTILVKNPGTGVATNVV